MRSPTLKNKTDFGKIIIRELFKQGKNQKYLANKLGITDARLSNMLIGRTKATPENVYKISKALSINIDLLLETLL